MLDRDGHTIIPGNITINGTIINTVLTNELNNRSLTNHSHNLGISDISNLQTELDNRSLTNHLHDDIYARHTILGVDNGFLIGLSINVNRISFFANRISIPRAEFASNISTF